MCSESLRNSITLCRGQHLPIHSVTFMDNDPLAALGLTVTAKLPARCCWKRLRCNTGGEDTPEPRLAGRLRPRGSRDTDRRVPKSLPESYPLTKGLVRNALLVYSPRTKRCWNGCTRSTA